jgi:aquaporin related protein
LQGSSQNTELSVNNVTWRESISASSKMPKPDYEYESESRCSSLRVSEKEEESSHSLLPYVGFVELQHKCDLLRIIMSEFVGTLFLVILGCGSCIGGDQHEQGALLDDQASIARISLCFGLTVTSMAQTIGHVSGCHINPAVTLAMVVGGQVGLVKGMLYVIAQCLGAIVGAAILQFLVPEDMRGADKLGMTSVADHVTLSQAVAVEMLITMVLVMVVFAAAADDINAAALKGSAPLAIGLSITTCHLFAVPLTGASMNPARSLGPALVLTQFHNHWVYWVGPMLGGFLAAVSYRLVLRARGEVKEPRTVKQVIEPEHFCEVKDESSVSGMELPSKPFNIQDVIACSQSLSGKELVWIEDMDK